MFETLVESGHHNRSSGRAGAVAFAVHIGIVAIAVNQTKAQFLAPPVITPIDMVIYQAPDVPPAASTMPSGPESDLPSSFVPTVSIPGPISIDPIGIDPTAAADPVGDLRRSISNDPRPGGFSVGIPLSGGYDGVLLSGEVDDPVRALDTQSPKYPRALEMAGIPGRVVLTFVVDTAGKVETSTLTVIEATDSAFAQSSRDAIMATRFAPARIRGQAVRQLVRQTHLFRSGT
jgi:TonB family protein